MQPRFVTIHLLSGDYPAMVTRDNGGDVFNLTVFADADIIYRNSVAKYVPEIDDDDADKIGMWSE